MGRGCPKCDRFRTFKAPPEWEDAALDRERLKAIDLFIAERKAEGGAHYRQSLRENTALVQRLFAATNDLRDLASGAALAAEPALLRAARYLGGPPVSADDLDTLVNTKVATRRRLDARLATEVAEVIGVFADRERCPWLYQTPPRSPTDAERELAARWTAGLPDGAGDSDA